MTTEIYRLLAIVFCVLVWLPCVSGAASAPDTTERWIIELTEPPFALQIGPGVRAIDAQATHEGRRAMERIEASQLRVTKAMNDTVRREVGITHHYRFALVGLAVTVTAQEAQQIAQLPGVARVVRDSIIERGEVDTRVALDRAPYVRGSTPGDVVADLIGAPQVWDGSATGDAGHLGEGAIVGVISTGINGDHPSFAAVGGDDYEHVNPFGEGVYVGDCFATPDVTCNSKLIGRWNFASGPSSIDSDGYGTYVAGLAAGNRLFDGPDLDDIGVSLVTGVAPHANVIAYRVCDAVCFGSAVLAAFDQAIADGVDVLVHTLGSPGDSPWEEVRAQAALAMRTAGVALTYTVNASGPAPGSLNLSLAAPWVATFSTTTHGGGATLRDLAALSGGDQPLPPVITGRSLTQGITAPIVFAGDYPNPSAPGTDPAQCLEPYPAGTFSGQIVVCQRGEIARLQKSMNVLSGGAAGIVLANVPGGLTSLGSDRFALPGINIRADDAAALLAWLGSGSDHVASIRFSDSEPDPEQADLVAAFNSRGPNLGLSYLAPSAAAPALDVVGPWIDPETFVVFSARGSAPGAGALALLKSAHPEWTAAEALSALMTTGQAPLREIDGVTPTAPFDHGGGRIDVAAAAAAGLVLDVTTDAFEAADPAKGGDPGALNLAGLVQLDCLGRCEWTREVRATRAGTWVSAGSLSDSAFDVRVVPAQFSLLAGDTQTLVIEVTHQGALPDGRYAGQVSLTPQDSSTPTTRLPLVIGLAADDDNDGVADAGDNCLGIANDDQRDTNQDGFGNACDADFNDDCVVNVVDLGLLREQFFQTGNLDTDLDGDGAVGTQDLARFRSLFFRAPGPSGTASCDQ